MTMEIKTFTLAMPYHLGHVNCYLLKADVGFVLIDTGTSNQCARLEQALHEVGCWPGDLKLIVLTHGDFDHTGNAAYLHQKFSVPLAMHSADFGMIEYGDMFASRSKPNPFLKAVAPRLFRFSASNRVTPDRALAAGDTLSDFGVNAQVISLPGHSRGSIGILLPGGDLFAGDLFENTKRPVLNSIMDDRAAAQASVEKLKSLQIKQVYPGHGAAFPLAHYQAA